MTRIEKLQTTGIRRLGTPGRGFRYVTADGRAPGPEDRDRIDALSIPPAWTDVVIAPSARGSLQAAGKDAAGRWQYRYHDAHVRRREEKKYERIVHFAQALPRMRRRVVADLRGPGLGRERVLACILRILSTCFIRPGSQVYADENGSYGLATLKHQHVRVKGDTVAFDFPGKSGKRQQREIRDRRVARIVRQLLQERPPGHEVFWFLNDGGEVVDVRRRHINDYIKEAMGERFSAKDFRTWAGTLICACALARVGADAAEAKTARKRKVVAAVKETAEQLGNTPAICRSSYIYPQILDSFERGRVVERYFDTVEDLVAHQRASLHGAEKALLELLKTKAA
ncbi:MAG: DNA topoisomerase IB [Gemmatimonadota bacterium]